jgi:hypothetical protein
MTDLERERLVRENLAARVGALIAENIELLLRINDLEQPATAIRNGHADNPAEKVPT